MIIKHTLRLDAFDAYAFIEELSYSHRVELEGVDVTRGIHPEHGSVVIVVPAFGASFVIKQQSEAAETSVAA